MEQSKWSLKRVLKIIGNAIFYLIIIALMIFSVANMKVKREDNLANLFGVGLLSVQTNSMSGTFEADDLLLVSMLDEADYENLQIGDVVTYFDISLHAFNTHRIVDIDYDQQFLITQADYNYNNPSQPTTPDDPVEFSRVIARYDGTMIAGAGAPLDYMQTSTGFALFVILPVLLVVIFETVILIKHFMALNREKIEARYAEEREQIAQSMETEREKLRAEILAEMQKEKALHA